MNDHSQEFPVCLKLHVFANHLYFFTQLNHSFTMSVCEWWYITDQNGISNIIWFVDILFRNYITTSNSTVQQDSSDLSAEIKRDLLLNIFINSNFHSWKARICVVECTKAPF